ncbi:MAG: hypothetical protein ACKVS9_11440 [Phycisphaerae bacterium]
MRHTLLQIAAMLTMGVGGAAAQTTIPWYTVDGGTSQTSAGGGFTLHATIGQPDAGLMTSTDFALVGGYRQPADASQTPCIGDVNGDGSVGLPDLAQMLAGFGSCEGDPNYHSELDLNSDLCIGITDLALLLSNFGVVCP